MPLTQIALASGNYDPVFSNLVNLTYVSVLNNGLPTQFMRVGNVVTVSGLIEFAAINTAIASSFDGTIPITSNFSFLPYAGGAGAILDQLQFRAVSIFAQQITLPVIQFNFRALTTSSNFFSYSYTYRIIL